MTQPWYPFFWSDYSGSTFNLTQGQHGAHLLFMRHIYTTGNAIPHKQRYSIARAMSEQEQADADYVLSVHYKREGDVWRNNKCENVMANAEKRHQKRVDAGKKGGQAKSSNAKAMLEQCSTNQNHNQNHIDTNVSIIDIPGTVAVLYDGAFQMLWHAYEGIGKGGVVSEALKGTRKKAQDAYFKIIIQTKEQDRETLIRNIADGAARYAGFVKQSGSISKHLSTWLSDRGWEQDYTINRAANDPVQRGPGHGHKPSYSDTVFASASQAIDLIRSRDGGYDRSAECEGYPLHEEGIPGIDRLSN